MYVTVYCKAAELSVLRDRGFGDYSYSRFRNSSRLFATRRSPSASAEQEQFSLELRQGKPKLTVVHHPPL